MAVTLGGACIGTLGGGAVERSLVKQALTELAQQNSIPRLSLHCHALSAPENASGMICGGEQTVVRHPCQPDEIPLFEQLANGQRGVLSLSATGIQFNPGASLPGASRFSRFESDWLYEESQGYSKHAYLIGGGHVSLALSNILTTLDFEITVIDERDHIDSFERNKVAHHKLRMPYSELAHAIPEGAHVFVFIMTHSHKTDETAAAQLLDKNVRYLGLLGSQKKIAELKSRLSFKFPAERLEQLRAPIGLPIYSHTPEEIAISIAAELIQLLNTP